MIPVYKPFLPKESIDYACEAISSTWISSQGKYITLATQKLQDKLNVKNLLLVNNGTSATHLLAKAVNYKYLNIKHVIAPNNVYVAALNSFLFDKNFKINTFDADLKTWNININNIDKTKNKLFLIVHNLGNIINVPLLKQKYPNNVFVEDNCEGLFGKYDGEYSGTQSFASSISFFGNKNITSGEGGAVIINDDSTYDYIKSIHGQGQSSKRFIHDYLGYNYRMTNVQAAILYGQLGYIDYILEKKQLIFNNYFTLLKNISNVSFQEQEKNTSHSMWMFGIRINNNISYEVAEEFFKNKKIEIRPMFYPISCHKHLLNNKYIKINSCDNAKILNKECIILPSYPELTYTEQSYIADCVLEYCTFINKK